MKNVLFAIGLVILGTILSISWAWAGTLTFGKDPEAIEIHQDISITGVSIEIDGFKVGGFADYCLAVWRLDPPIYPLGKKRMGRGGYIEPLCLNTVRSKAIKGWSYPTGAKGPVLVPAGDWKQDVDLTKTPIYMPAGTELVCNSLGAVSSLYPAASMNGTCKIDYEPYHAGAPRYRFLRLPYFDQTFSKSVPLVSSYFQNYQDGHPLYIPSVVAYERNNHQGSQMAACLIKTHVGEQIAELCFPSVDEESPGQLPVGWTIGAGDQIALNCYYPADDAVSSGDCVAYLIAQIPSGLELSPENAFRDYGELPRNYIPKWCAETASVITQESVSNPMLCLGASSCSRQEKLSNCQDVFDKVNFPPASCMANNSCWAH